MIMGEHAHAIDTGPKAKGISLTGGQNKARHTHKIA